MTTPSDIRHSLDRLVPLVAHYWNRPVKDYSHALYEGVEPPQSDIRRDGFSRLCNLFRRCAARSGYSRAETDQLIDFIQRRPTIQTGPHCHLMIEPDAFYTHLFSMMGLTAHCENWYVSYSVSTVKFTEKAKKGPGWLRIDGQDVNVFGLSRRQMEPYSICGRHALHSFALKPTDGMVNQTTLDRLASIIPGQEFCSAAEAIKSANKRLWQYCFGPDNKLLQIDDADVALLVQDHLRDPDSWLTRCFIDAPDMIAAFLQAVDKLNDGPRSGWFKFNTHFFWFVREGRLRPLRLQGTTLSNDEGTYKIRFNSRSLADALEVGDIVPGLFLVFLVIAILPGLRAMGGSRQVVYYPLMRSTLLAALDCASTPRNTELAKDIRSDLMPSVWGHRTITPVCVTPWQFFVAENPETLASLLQRFGQLTLAEASADLPGFTGDELWCKCSGQDLLDRI